MKLNTANAIRADFIKLFADYLAQKGEDIGLINSNTLNFPIVTSDGEEGWVEIVVKVPKGTKDEDYDGYSRREQYAIDCKAKAEKKAKAEEAKAKKIAKDKARREKSE